MFGLFLLNSSARFFPLDYSSLIGLIGCVVLVTWSRPGTETTDVFSLHPSSFLSGIFSDLSFDAVSHTHVTEVDGRAGMPEHSVSAVTAAP